MTRTLRLSIISIVPFLILLFSLSVFPCKASAKVLTDFPMTFSVSSNTNYYSVIVTDVEPDVNFLFAFNYYSDSAHTNSRTYPTFVFDRQTSYTLLYESWSTGSVTSSRAAANNTIVVDGVTYYYTSHAISGPFSEPISNISYDSIEQAIRDGISGEPEFAEFGLDNFKYITSFNNTLVGYYSLDYTCYWSGSTSPDFPLTNVNFEIYGFYHKDTPNTEFDNPYNAVLLNSGSSVNSGTTFDFRQWVNHINISGTPYEKFVLYLIPFSNSTQGNTSYIQADLYKTFLTMNLGPFSINDDDSDGLLLGFDASFNDGVIPVIPTDSIDNVGVNYIDGVPVIATVNNISGSFNKEFNINHTTNNYNPVVYVTNDNSVNDYRDMSNNITNNNTYNFNFTGKINTDDDDASINGIIAFLTALVTFFNTFWSYVIVCLNWLPSWCITFIITVFSSAASIVIALGIFKLLRGG